MKTKPKKTTSAGKQEKGEKAPRLAEFITDKAVRAMSLAPGQRKAILNDAPDPKASARSRGTSWVPGFGVRMSIGGTRTFVLRYRRHGVDRVIRIGEYGAAGWSVEAARKRAAELRRLVDDGRDPQDERNQERKAPTVAELFERFERDHGHKLRESTREAYRAAFDTHVRKPLGKRKAADVSHSDIDELHAKISRKATKEQDGKVKVIGGKYAANRTVAMLSRLFSLALRKEDVTTNPCKGQERNTELKRRRYLKPEEATRLLHALPKLKHRGSADAIRLLLLTGARKSEVLSARWDQFDLKDGKWTKPAATTKQKTDHEVPLSAAARALLADMHTRTRGGEFLFPGHGTAGHQEDLKNAWASVRRLAKLPDVRIHDLRHSYASFLASGGASLPIIGALLGHTQAATTQRYAHLLDDPQRKATEGVGALVDGLQAGTQADVVPITTGKTKRAR